MATGKVTKRAVDSLKTGLRDVFLWDTDRKGFGVKLTPTGKLVYILQYRMGGRASPVRRYTIGSNGTWTPDGAGKEAERLLVMVAQGTDPAHEKQRSRIVATELAFDAYAQRFLEREVKPNWKRSYGFAESLLRLHIKPALGKTPLPSIGRADLVRLFDGLPANKPAVRRNSFAVLRRLFRWAKGRGDLDRNPLEGFEAPAIVASRDRVLTDDELRLVLLGSRDLTPPYGSFVRLLAITGQRRNEVAELDWKELDRGKRQWLLPALRAKNGVEHLIPLTDMAIAEIDGLAGGDTWPRRGLAFAATKVRPDAKPSPISGFSKAKKALDGAMIKLLLADQPDALLDSWRLHDLRRSMATNMQRLRIAGDVIEACENRIAGRSKSGAARIYQRHDFEEEKREAMNRWDAFLANLLAPAANVVLLKSADA